MHLKFHVALPLALLLGISGAQAFPVVTNGWTDADLVMVAPMADQAPGTWDYASVLSYPNVSSDLSVSSYSAVSPWSGFDTGTAGIKVAATQLPVIDLKPYSLPLTLDAIGLKPSIGVIEPWGKRQPLLPPGTLLQSPSLTDLADIKPFL